MVRPLTRDFFPRTPSRSGHTPPLEAPRHGRLALVGVERRWPIDGDLYLGAAADNDVVIADPFASAHHAVIVCQGGRAAVHDCGSRNGLVVAGARVDRAELSPGVRFAIGRTVLAVEELARTDDEDESMIGPSAALAELRRRLARLAPTRATVLLLGETGSGKELAARALHERSGRPGALCAVNCATLAPNLVESELFGHEKGAFSGAVTRKVGLFEAATRGTLFLDEIGDLPLDQQAKLLRALETGRIRPVGAVEERPVDVRVVAATHKDLVDLVRRGQFREDLYHRLATAVRVPPLRERPEDVLPLARHFLARQARDHGPRVLTPRAEARLRAHAWPGNVRELAKVIEQAVIFTDAVIDERDLFAADDGGTAASAPLLSSARRIIDVERDAIEIALRSTDGDCKAAALSLGIAKSTFYEKLKRYGIAGWRRRGKGGDGDMRLA